ncbi:MAG: hypothetical protein LBL00_08260, partial [Endomicrobium sp.]|nr:hypothetical protein [Endomicrobium sp.]
TVTFDNKGRVENNEQKKKELQFRVEQFFEKGGNIGGGYKTTNYREGMEILAQQSGVDKEEVEKMLEQVEPDKLEETIGILAGFFEQRGEIINCSTDALSTVFNTMSREMISSLQALISDIFNPTKRNSSLNSIIEVLNGSRLYAERTNTDVNSATVINLSYDEISAIVSSLGIEGVDIDESISFSNSEDMQALVNELYDILEKEGGFEFAERYGVLILKGYERPNIAYAINDKKLIIAGADKIFQDLPKENIEERASYIYESFKEIYESVYTNISDTANQAKSPEYDRVVDELAQQSGVDKEEVEKILEQVEPDKFDEVIGILAGFFDQRVEIINCATDALSTVLTTMSKGMLALQALISDISAGIFNEDSVKDGQLVTSANAIKEVLTDNGVDAEGYALAIDEFINNLSAGDEAILWVNGDHFVTVKKNEDGTFGVTDINRNEGQPLNYGQKEFSNLLSGKDAKTTDGQEVKGYTKAADEDNKIKVITYSQAIREAAGEEAILSTEELSAIKGSAISMGNIDMINNLGTISVTTREQYFDTVLSPNTTTTTTETSSPSRSPSSSSEVVTNSGRGESSSDRGVSESATISPSRTSASTTSTSSTSNIRSSSSEPMTERTSSSDTTPTAPSNIRSSSSTATSTGRTSSSDTSTSSSASQTQRTTTSTQQRTPSTSTTSRNPEINYTATITETTVKDLVDKTGLTAATIVSLLSEAEKKYTGTNFTENVIKVLQYVLGNGVELASISVQVLSQLTGKDAKALGFSLLLSDIAAGIITKENLSVKTTEENGKKYIETSMYTMKQAASQNGKEMIGFGGITLDELIVNLKAGDSTIVWVDGNNFIYVTKIDTKQKDAAGKTIYEYQIYDADRNQTAATPENGLQNYGDPTTGALTYDEENFRELMSGKNATSIDGKTDAGYKVDTGDMSILVDKSSGLYSNLNSRKPLAAGSMQSIKADNTYTDKVKVAVTGVRTQTNTSTITAPLVTTAPGNTTIRQVQQIITYDTIEYYTVYEEREAGVDWAQEEGYKDEDTIRKENEQKNIVNKEAAAVEALKRTGTNVKDVMVISENKNKAGEITSYTVTDPTKNSGKSITYSVQEYEKLMKGEAAVDVDGIKHAGFAEPKVTEIKTGGKVTGYTLVDPNKNDGKEIKLNVEEFNDLISGKNVTVKIDGQDVILQGYKYSFYDKNKKQISTQVQEDYSQIQVEEIKGGRTRSGQSVSSSYRVTNGNKVLTYTADEFNKLIRGEIANCIDEKGNSYSTQGYQNVKYNRETGKLESASEIADKIVISARADKDGNFNVAEPRSINLSRYSGDSKLKDFNISITSNVTAEQMVIILEFITNTDADGLKGYLDMQNIKYKEDSVYGYDSNTLIENISAQTGKSDEDVLDLLLKAQNTQQDKAYFAKSMQLLNQFFAYGGSLATSSSISVAKTITPSSPGIENWYGFEMVMDDVANGIFGDNSILVIPGQNGSRPELVLINSLAAIQNVANNHRLDNTNGASSGKAYNGYEVTGSTLYTMFTQYFTVGDTAIIQLDAFHTISVTKKDDGIYEVVDSSVDNGNPVQFTKTEFYNLLINSSAKSTTNKKYNGYSIKADHKVRISTNLRNTVTTRTYESEFSSPKSIELIDTKLSNEQMSELPKAGFYLQVSHETAEPSLKYETEYRKVNVDGKDYYYRVSIASVEIETKKVNDTVWVSSFSDWETNAEGIFTPKQGTTAELEANIAQQMANIKYLDMQREAYEKNLAVEIKSKTDASNGLAATQPPPKVNPEDITEFNEKEIKQQIIELTIASYYYALQLKKDVYKLANPPVSLQYEAYSRVEALRKDFTALAGSYNSAFIGGTGGNLDNAVSYLFGLMVSNSADNNWDIVNYAINIFANPIFAGAVAAMKLADPANTAIDVLIGIINGGGDVAAAIKEAMASGELKLTSADFLVGLAVILSKGEFFTDSYTGDINGAIVVTNEGAAVFGEQGLIGVTAFDKALVPNNAIEKIRKDLDVIYQDGNYQAVIDYLQYNGYLQSETAFDKNGEEMYTAVKTGSAVYKDEDGKSHRVTSMQYKFQQDYSNNVTITSAKAGESKLVIEDYRYEKVGGQDVFNFNSAVTYSLEQTGESSEKFTYSNAGTGLEINLDGFSIKSLERQTLLLIPTGVEIDEKKRSEELKQAYGSLNDTQIKNIIRQEKNPVYLVAKSVDFTNSADGNLTAFEEISIGVNGVVEVTRYDLADAVFNDINDLQEAIKAAAVDVNEGSVDSNTAVERISADEETNTITYISEKGFKEGEIVVDNLESLEFIKKMVEEENWSYSQVTAYLKYKGELQSETKYDSKGEKIYTANRSFAKSNNVGMEYEFFQDYDNKTDLVNLKAGDKRFVIEEIGTYKDIDGKTKYAITGAMTYTVGGGRKTYTSNGASFEASIGYLERAAKYTYPYSYEGTDEYGNKKTYNCEGEAHIVVFGKDGNITAFEEAILLGDDQVSVSGCDLTGKDVIIPMEEHEKQLEASSKENNESGSSGSGGSSSSATEQHDWTKEFIAALQSLSYLKLSDSSLYGAANGYNALKDNEIYIALENITDDAQYSSNTWEDQETDNEEENRNSDEYQQFEQYEKSEQFQIVLEKLRLFNIDGLGSLYEAANNFINNKVYVELSMARVFSYSSENPNMVNLQGSHGGDQTILSFEIENPSDWRVNPDIISDSELNTVSIIHESESGESTNRTYNNITVDSDYSYSFEKTDTVVVQTLQASDTNSYSTAIFSVNPGDIKDFSWNLEEAKQSWSYEHYDYFRKDAQSQWQISAITASYKPGYEFQMGSGSDGNIDTIIIDESVYFKVELQGSGYVVTEGSTNISGTYAHHYMVGVEKNEQTGKMEIKYGDPVYGKFTGKIDFSATGDKLFNGKVDINKGDTFKVGKSASGSGGGGGSGSGSLPTASDTNAVIIEHDDYYEIKDGSLSLRDGNLVAIGDGAILKRGSYISSLGNVTAGSLRMSLNASGNYDYFSVGGTVAKTELENVDDVDSFKTTILYDGDGVISVARVNSAGDSETIEYQVYNKDRNSYDIIYNNSGEASSITTVKFTHQGYSTLGYEVDAIGLGNPTLHISEDGDVLIMNVRGNAEIAKINYTNTSGEYSGAQFVTVYTQNYSYGAKTVNELRLTDGTRIVMQQIDDGSWYGAKAYTANAGSRSQHEAYDLIRLTFNLDAAGNAANEGEFFKISNPMEGAGAVTYMGNNTYSLVMTSENIQKTLTFSIINNGELDITTDIKKFRAWSDQRGAEVWSDFTGAVSVGEYTIVEGSHLDKTEYFLMKDDGTFQVLRDGMKIGTFATIHSKDAINKMISNGEIRDYDKDVINKAEEWFIQINGPPIELQDANRAQAGEFSNYAGDSFGNIFA